MAKKNFRKIIKKIMYLFLAIIALLIVVGVWFVNQPQFGKNPSGERLARIEKSPHYKDGKFQNLSETPQFTGNKNIVMALLEFFTKNSPYRVPKNSIPNVKTDLKKLDPNDNSLVWFGHSGYYMQLDGKKFLIDPTLISASPISFYNKPFNGSSGYRPEDIPTVDYLIITHDHWDHLDYQTIISLKNRIGKVITSLGVGSHFEYWGFTKEQIIELDWQEKIQFENFTLTCLPARHFSGRGLSPKKTLWSSFMLESLSKTIYIGGDSGYDDFYKEIGRKFPKIDWAILENGQYDADWALIHILPEQIPQVIKDLNPKHVLAVHNSKYALSKHAWREPLDKIYENAQKNGFNLATPKIGEIVQLNNENQSFEKWWSDMKE